MTWATPGRPAEANHASHRLREVMPESRAASNASASGAGGWRLAQGARRWSSASVRPAENTADRATEEPLLLGPRELVRVEQVVEALRPAVGVLVAGDGVVTGPHDALDSEGIDRLA